MAKQMPGENQLERTYDEHAQALFAFVLNLTRNEHDTRDLLQELFVKLAERPGMLTGVRNVRAFLLRLAHNLVVDLLRRRSSREKTVALMAAEEPSFFTSATDHDEDAFRKALSAALGELPADQRAVVHLKLWEGMTFEEIAGLLEVSPNTAASRYRYGLDKLRARLRPVYDELT